MDPIGNYKYISLFDDFIYKVSRFKYKSIRCRAELRAFPSHPFLPEIINSTITKDGIRKRTPKSITAFIRGWEPPPGPGVPGLKVPK